MKKTGLFVVLLLIIVLGAGTTASFAACTATTLSAGSGTWGIEAYGQELSPTSQLDNILIQVTFASGGTFSGTEWQSLGWHAQQLCNLRHVGDGDPGSRLPGHYHRHQPIDPDLPFLHQHRHIRAAPWLRPTPDTRWPVLWSRRR